MQVFKTALRVFFRHPIYLVIYILWLGFMGVFMGMSISQTGQGTFTAERPDVAIIDRDDSAFSKGLASFLGEHAQLVTVADDQRALQDATAQNLAAYIVIVPDGFGQSFMDAAENGGETPVLDTIVSYESYAGPMMDNLVNEYLNTARIYVSTGTVEAGNAGNAETGSAAGAGNAAAGAVSATDAAKTGSAADTAGAGNADDIAELEAKVTALAADDLARNASVSVWQTGESSSISSRYVLYMDFSVYPAMLAIIICVAVVMSAFSRGEVRRRDFASSTSALSMNLQIGLACLVIALIVWVWIGGIGLVVFGGELFGAAGAAGSASAAAGASVATGTNVAAIVSGLATLLVFCMVALALGFLIGQLTGSELVMNAAGNIIGLVLSFMGGTWISLDLMGEPMATIARFTPTFYYGDALSQAYGLQTAGSGSAFAADLGIMALFAVAIFAVALAIGRVRRQTTRSLVPAAEADAA